MENVRSFIEWALKRAKNDSVPKGAVLPIPADQVGSVTESEYLWGTSGRVVTQSLIDDRFKSYYSKNGWTQSKYDNATKGWVAEGKYVTDCQGLLDWYMKKDTNANGNYNNFCTDKGLCSSINRPYVIGEAVFNGSDSRKTHVGWVCGFMPNGDPVVIEARGLSYGVVLTRMSKRAWKYRGLMTKKFYYDDAVEQNTNGKFKFTRLLKYGVSGDDVNEMKKLLAAKGYTAGVTIDGKNSDKFRSKTRTLVKMYQRDNGLTIDGIAGKNTISSLGGVWNG